MSETQVNEEFYWFLFHKATLLLKKIGDKYTIPLQHDSPFEYSQETYIHQNVLTLNDKICKAYDLKEAIPESDQYVMIDLRASYTLIEENLYLAAGKCYQFVHWYRTSNFCPACGAKMETKGPIKRLCPQCKFSSHPIVFTCIIVLIRNENKIFLVRSKSHRGTYYSNVAGYLESGESLEKCVQREIMEETGFKVKNLQYFGSQTWPYPSQLMVAFVCDYDSGECKIQESEILTGGWFAKDNLPEIPPRLSISRRMIDWWLDNQK